MPAIDGHRDQSDCEAWDATFWGAVDPSKAANCNLPQDQVYPTGAYPFGGAYGIYTNIPIPGS